MDIPIAANTLGTLGAVCWSIQLIPQIIINYRRHSTEGLQRSMMLLWALAGIPLGAYNVSNNFNIALKIQPQILTMLSLITWIQCFYYSSNWALARCILLISLMAVILGGVEVGLIYALFNAIEHQRYWLLTLMGVLSTVLLSLGVLRHYYDIYTHRTVRGISFIFVGIDALGDVFSLISIFFQSELDVLGIVIYATEFVLWCGVFACGGYFNLLPWVKTKINQRKKLRREEGQNSGEGGVANQETIHEAELQRVGSSTSVFRTPSSVASLRTSARVGDWNN